MKISKLKMFAFTLSLLGNLFGWKDEVPIDGKEIKLSDEEKRKAQEALGENFDLDTVLGKINKEIAAVVDKEAGKKTALEAAQNELSAIMDQAGYNEEEKEKLLESAEGNEIQLAEQIKNLGATMNGKMSELQGKIDKLINEPEADTPDAVLEAAGKVGKLIHSATHLFGSNKAYDAFDGRNWNKRAAGMTTSATDFSDKVQVEKLNGDVDLYYRENPDKLKSLQRDTFGLPAFWPKRLNVDDKVSDGTILTAEITQARKLPWLPKNKQKIEAEEGKIYPVQIDAEFIGFNLQKMEASWLNSYNKEGSQAYKMSFVMFLVSELDKKARVEDRVSSIKGIHVATPETATTAASYMQRQNGLLYQIWKAINVTGKLTPFNLGLPTSANIVDYVDDMIEALPEAVRHTQGLKFYLSKEWLKAYKRRYELEHGTYTDYKGYPENPKDYNNIEFVPLVDLSGLDIMFITYDDNIEILENVPAEKSKYHFEMLKRIMYIFADYKLGIRLIHIGATTVDGDPDEFKVQTIWSNNVPVFSSDTFIPVYDDTTGKVALTYSNLVVDDGWATTITEFTGGYEGQIIRVKGNTSIAGATTVADGAKINLTGDAAFNLKLGGTLTLRNNGDGTVTEIKRTTAPASLPDGTIEFATDTFNADAGSSYLYTGGTDALEGITGGVEGQEIVITGGANGDLTINDVASNIEVASEAVVSEDDTITLTKVDGVWTEISRDISA